MPKLTENAICYVRTDPYNRKASLLTKVNLQNCSNTVYGSRTYFSGLD